MTNTRMKNAQPQRPQLRDKMVSALADGAAGILLHVKWPLLLEMEIEAFFVAAEEAIFFYDDGAPTTTLYL